MIDSSYTVEPSETGSYGPVPQQFVFRLSSLEEQFKWLFPEDDFGRCWPFVDRFVSEYPELFRGEEFDVEGIKFDRDEEGEFVVADCSDEARWKIRQALELLMARMSVDGLTDVVPFTTNAGQAAETRLADGSTAQWVR